MGSIKLSLTKKLMGIQDKDDLPIDDGKPKNKRGASAELNKKIPTQYNKYTGIVNDDGKTIRNPTAIESMKNMVQYLKHNTPESNVYRPEHAHTTILYNKKQKQTSA